MTGNIWLITGVGGGLGKALAEAVLANGGVVAGTVRGTAAKQAFEAAAPGRAHGFVMDVRDGAAIASTVAAVEKLAPLDVLVNNAGYGLTGAIEEASLAQARDQFEVNLFGPLALIQAVLPAMRARKAGTIVNITSVSGLAAWQGTGLYCASKFALEAIGESLRDEVAPLGIRVMNAEPGAIRTGFAARSVRAARRLPDYETTAHESERILAAQSRREAGDPARMAAHILAAVNSGAPPRHLLLGADAVHYATRRMEEMLAGIADGSAARTDTAFPD